MITQFLSDVPCLLTLLQLQLQWWDVFHFTDGFTPLFYNYFFLLQFCGEFYTCNYSYSGGTFADGFASLVSNYFFLLQFRGEFYTFNNSSSIFRPQLQL